MHHLQSTYPQRRERSGEVDLLYISAGLVDSDEDEMEELGIKSFDISPKLASVTSFSVAEGKGRNYTVKKPVNVTENTMSKKGGKTCAYFTQFEVP